MAGPVGVWLVLEASARTAPLSVNGLQLPVVMVTGGLDELLLDKLQDEEADTAMVNFETGNLHVDQSSLCVQFMEPR